MSTHDSNQLDRLLELLADRATAGLGQPELAELDALLAAEAAQDVESMDRAAAALAIGLAWQERDAHPLPADLVAKLESQARQAIPASGVGPGPDAAYRQNAARALSAGDEPASTLKLPPPGEGWKVWAGWLAAAACLLLAAVAWLRTPVLSGTGTADVRTLVDRASGTVERTWGAWPAKTDDPAAKPFSGADAVKGKVVWNQQLQKGYMVFSGLTPNTPTSTQYQLWIIDKNQKNPIDGGVFDITASGEVVVPIAAKLAVKDLVGFGVTVEPPGGVVVSDQTQRVVVALLGQ